MSTPVANVPYTFDHSVRMWVSYGRPPLPGSRGLTPQLTLAPSALLTPSGD